MSYYPFYPYDPIYPKLYEDEKNRIQGFLGEAAIEHFGSTSVKGLGGKGYIDIYVVVPPGQLEHTSQLLQSKLGYEFKANAGKEGERLFHQRKVKTNRDSELVYHLHLTYFGNKGFEKDINFRDFLRNSEEARNKYSQAKQKASLEANKVSDKETAKKIYMEVKGPVIGEIMKACSC